ncbi:helix-turn-helix transcriptional regulator [bacterium]|nr:helix-turn-helix transcriptional regulator [bacterium]
MTEREIVVIFGQRLKRAREKANLTQAELAEKVGVSTNFIGMVERAERNTKFANVYNLITALGYTLESFFEGL